MTFIPPPNDQRMMTNSNSNIDTDLIDDALWDDWDLPTTANKKTPGKIRTMSSPAVHSRTMKITETTPTTNPLESTKADQSE